MTPIAVRIASDGQEADGSRIVDAVAALIKKGVSHAVVRASYGATVAEIGLYPATLTRASGDPAELRDAVIENLLGNEGIHPAGYSPDTVYTNGDCDVFAVALKTILDDLGWTSDLHAVFDPHDDKGRRSANPYLIHCGVRIYMPGEDGAMSNHVLDVQGCTPEERWNLRWSENGNCSQPIVDTVTRRRLEKAQQEDITIDRISDAMPFAAIVVAAVLGLESVRQIKAA